MKELDETFKAIKKRTGADMVHLWRDIRYEPVNTISTGSLALDYGIGGNRQVLGIPIGRVTLIWGSKGCGKSTVCYHVIGNAQASGKVVAVVDTEFSFDAAYATACGVIPDEIIWINTFDSNSGEQFSSEEIWTAIEMLSRDKAVDVIVVDSMDNLISKRELDGEFGESNMGVTAKSNGQAMRKLMGLFSMNEIAFVGVSQRRYNLGIKFGNPETMAGGEALKHAASLRIDMSQSSEEKDAGEAIGRKTKFRIAWNKIGPPGATGEFVIRYGFGIDKYDELISFAIENGIIERKGPYYYLDDQTSFKGSGALADFLAEDMDAYQSISERVRNILSGQGHVEESKDDSGYANGSPVTEL